MEPKARIGDFVWFRLQGANQEKAMITAIHGDTEATIELVTGPQAGKIFDNVPWGIISEFTFINIDSFGSSVPEEFREAILKLGTEFPGGWTVSVITAPANDKWQLRLRSPQGEVRVADLEPEQQTGRAVQNALRKMRDSCLKSAT
jgi:hypothetical protein